MSEEKTSEQTGEDGASDKANDKPKKATTKAKPKGKGKVKKKKKKKPEAPPKPPLMDRLRGSYAIGKSGFKDLLYSFISPDPLTRKMSRRFLLSLLGLLVVGYGAYYRYKNHYWRIEMAKQAKILALKKKEDMARLEAEALRKHKMIYLGEFGVELKRAQGVEKTEGLLNQASIELVAECDQQETKDLIEAELQRVRGSVTSVLMALSRKEVFSRDGKMRLRKAITDKINAELPKGKVIDVYFTGLIVN